jgi:hypothetical protein
MTLSLREAHDAAALGALVRACIAANTGRHALLVPLAPLWRKGVKPHHARLIQAALEPLLVADRAQSFHLPDHTVAIVWRESAPGRLDAVLQALRVLLVDLPGPEPLDAEGAATVPITLLHLPEEADALLRAVEATLGEPADAAHAERLHLLPPLDLPTLAAMEQALVRADLSGFLRRRPVCAVSGGATLQLRRERRFLSLPAIAEALTPERDPEADPWLLRRLLRTLDRRLLVLLGAPEMRERPPFALTLQVASLTTAEFLRFDATLSAAVRGEIWLELRAADILADPAAFLFARDFIRLRGYRLALRGLPAVLLPAFMPTAASLGFDALHLRYAAELERLPPDCLARLRDMAPSMVLTRTDHAGALDWGLSQGITQFEGTLIEPDSQPSAIVLLRRELRAGAQNEQGLVLH